MTLRTCIPQIPKSLNFFWDVFMPLSRAYLNVPLYLQIMWYICSIAYVPG